MQVLKDLLKGGLDTTSTDVPTEMEVNELLARNRDELMIFEDMDAQRGQSRHRDRLMTEKELPEWVTKSAEQDQAADEV